MYVVAKQAKKTLLKPDIWVYYAITFYNGKTVKRRVNYKLLRYYHDHVLDNILNEKIQCITLYKEPLL